MRRLSVLIFAFVLYLIPESLCAQTYLDIQSGFSYSNTGPSYRLGTGVEFEKFGFHFGLVSMFDTRPTKNALAFTSHFHGNSASERRGVWGNLNYRAWQINERVALTTAFDFQYYNGIRIHYISTPRVGTDSDGTGIYKVETYNSDPQINTAELSFGLGLHVELIDNLMLQLEGGVGWAKYSNLPSRFLTFGEDIYEVIPMYGNISLSYRFMVDSE